MILMIVFVLMLLFNNGKIPTSSLPANLTKEQNESNSIIVFSIFSILIILALISSFVLNYNEFKKLFASLYQISNVFYAVIYIIFLILFYNLIPKHTLNN